MGTDQQESQDTEHKEANNADGDAGSKPQADPQESPAKDSDFEDITDEAVQYRNDSRKEDATLPKL